MEGMGSRILFSLLALPALLPAQTGASFPIDSIKIEGNRILPGPGILAVALLKPGGQGSTAIFDAARDRLLGTGYFETVGYQFKPSAKGGIDLTLDVQEMQPLYGIATEALPITTDEAIAWLKNKDPLFTGRMPGTQQTLDRAAAMIDELLAQKQATLQVGGKVIITSPNRYVIQFMPSTGLPAVADVVFEGSKVYSVTDLRNSIGQVAFGQLYTEANFRALLDSQVRRLFEKKGYMRVKFGAITTRPSETVKGLDVRVQVEDGPQYELGEVGVHGPMENASKRILRMANVPKMTVADFDQMDDAAKRIREGMKKDGYLDADVTVDKDINDESKKVDAYFVVAPGPQYTFGRLDVKGLGLDGEAAVRKAWGVKTGEAYPGDYPDYFLSQMKDYFDNLGAAKAFPDIHHDTNVVDVTLDFKYAPPVDDRKKPGGRGIPPL
jgi:outer membrane protein insertion porin family